MTAPKLSIVIPVFNGEKVIGRCLEGLESQDGVTPGDVEVIVVDDGSTDGTWAKAEGHCVKLVRQKENRGAAAARNRGAKEATADLILFVDADVVLESAAVSRVIELFIKRPEVSAAVGRYSDLPMVAGLVNLYHNHFTVYHHDLSPPEIDWFWGAISAVRKSAFAKAGGFDERYQGASAEDMELGRVLASLGYLIVYEPSIRGAHAHDFTLGSILANDYKKAVLGTKLRLSGRLPKKAPGFAGPRNIISIGLILVFFFVCVLYFLYSELGNFYHDSFWLFVGLIVILGLIHLINLQYFRTFNLLINADTPINPKNVPYLHILQLLAILAGAMAGIVGYLLGRDTYGRPGWI